ncbi:MAG: hypothetical protein ACRC6E_09785 [Fusobacteriaceae bacterium]
MLNGLIVQAVFTLVGYAIFFVLIFALLSMLGRFLEMIFKLFWF